MSTPEHVADLSQENTHPLFALTRILALCLYFYSAHTTKRDEWKEVVIKLLYKVQTFNSSRVKPRPARTRVWYLNVGQWTIGRRGPETGLGIIAAAFFLRTSRRRCLRAGWLNQDRTNRCQSLWKCPLGIILFPFPIFAKLSTASC